MAYLAPSPTRSTARRALVATVCALALLGAPLLAAPATAAPTWAPAATAAVHPGVQTFTNGAQCTANFIYTMGTTVFIGQAAHCAGTGASTDTNGCVATSLPLGTKVTVTGASKPGVMVYSSWLTMQAAHETRADACAYNDIALVQLDPADVAKVNPSVPAWGGPTGVGGGANVGDKVYSYGNSELRGGVTALSPKVGVSIGDAGNGWTHQVYSATPGIPGDSGSGLLDASGRAIGVLSTISIAPTPASNNYSDLAHMLTYMRNSSTFDVALALGTTPFSSSLTALVP
ncbi:MAG: hypothetical protein JWM05_3606 [Acidimicrobiales bacterium]|nr:hypothetical protein [Acidimicrobiales bacterium]